MGDLAGLVVPGGALVLDYGFVAESLLPGLALQEEPMTIGGVEATAVNTYDTVESRFWRSSRSVAATRCTTTRPYSACTPQRR